VRAKQSLRQALCELRTAVGEGLEIGPDSVGLRQESLSVDSRQFLRDIQDEAWTRALGRWQGDFLSGLDDVGDEVWRDWITAERAAFSREFQRAREASGELALPTGPGADPQQAGPVAPASAPVVRDFSLGLLGTLSTDARAVLETAAVVGIRSEGCLLRRVTTLSAAGFESAMSELVSRGMLREAEDARGTWEFASASTRKRVYNVTAAYRRQALHAQVADALDSGVTGQVTAAGDAVIHARMAEPQGDPARAPMAVAGLGLVALMVLALAWRLLL
jgi:hypothetical protein